MMGFGDGSDVGCYGMVNVNLYSAIIMKVSNALDHTPCAPCSKQIIT